MTVTLLTIIGQDCVKDCDSDYLHMKNRHVVGIFATPELAAAADKRWREVYNEVEDTFQDLDSDPDPDIFEASEAYDKASPHEDISGSLVAGLFWNNWAEELYDYKSEIKEYEIIDS